MTTRTESSRQIVVDGRPLTVTGTLVKTARIADEWYDDVDDPEAFVRGIRAGARDVDIFTFWQRLPDTEPRHPYHMEPDGIAALPVADVGHWLARQLNSKTRNLLRKSEKMGVVVREAAFDDAFVDGMADIFNETPIRQQKPFWHYGKTPEVVRREFSRYLFREELFGAYHNQELIGFIFLANAGKYALLGQIISKIRYRHLAPNNALIAKAVEVCEGRKTPYLVYSKWSDGTLGHFKRQNGFQRFDLPRYYVPLTTKGSLALRMRLHHGMVGLIPPGVRGDLVSLRSKWFAWRLPVP